MTGSADVRNDGFTLKREALASGLLAKLLSVVLPADERLRERHFPHALRNVLWDRCELARTLTYVGVDDIASEVLGRSAFAINAIYFDKTSRANWKVPCHQDLVMPVDAKVDEPGFTGWTVKAGVPHVEAPTGVLAGLAALRIHFDDCPAANGSLSVLPGSHHRGKLRDADLAILDRESFVDCEALVGDVFIMKPLLVHRSSAALDPQHRRVLHVVYATEEPGLAIRWKRSAQPGVAD
jgi:hypothetical protein